MSLQVTGAATAAPAAFAEVVVVCRRQSKPQPLEALTDIMSPACSRKDLLFQGSSLWFLYNSLNIKTVSLFDPFRLQVYLEIETTPLGRPAAPRVLAPAVPK